MKKRKGTALVLVVCVFTLTIMWITIMTTLTTHNAVAARKQQERVQAYYLVQAGMEIGRYAVMLPVEIDDASGLLGDGGDQEEWTILNDVRDHPDNASLLSDTIEFDDSSIVKIKLSATDEDGNAWSGIVGQDEVWLQIAVVGTIKNGNGGETSHAGSLRISTMNPAKTVRELESPLDI